MSTGAFRPELREVVDDVLAPHTGAEAPADVASSALWSTVAGLGWPLVGMPEERGGAGGDLADVVELVAGVARHGVALPLADTALAVWLLGAASLDVTVARDGAAVVVGEVTAEETGDGWRLRGTPTDVPWLPAVGTLVVAVAAGDGRTVVAVVDLDAAGVTLGETGADIAGEPRGDVVLDGVAVEAAVVDLDPAAVRAREAVVRAAVLDGALEGACGVSAEHVRTREQFGKPLAAFQAVGHQIADMIVERDLARVALRAAVESAGPDGVPGREAAAVARAVAGRAAGVVAEGAHQLLGAMGITREHPLHLSTRRLWAGRDRGGSRRRWEQTVGEYALAGTDDDAVWRIVTGT